MGGSQGRLCDCLTALGWPLLFRDVAEQLVLTANGKNTLPPRPYTKLHFIECLRVLSKGRLLQRNVRTSGMKANISLLKVTQRAPVLLHMQVEPDSTMIAIAPLHARTVHRIPVRSCLISASWSLLRSSLASPSFPLYRFVPKHKPRMLAVYY